VSANLEAPDLEAWLKLQPLPPPRKGIARNRLAVADAAIVKEQYYLFGCQRETLISS
jgi:hypothetical protein